MYIKSVKSRVFLIFIVFLFAISINSIWSVINFRRLNNSIERILDSNYKSIVAAQKMIASIERQDSLQLSYLFTKKRGYIKNFTINKKEFLVALKDAQNNITEQGESKIVNQIAKEYGDYVEEFNNFLFLKEKHGFFRLWKPKSILHYPKCTIFFLSRAFDKKDCIAAHPCGEFFQNLKI